MQHRRLLWTLPTLASLWLAACGQVPTTSAVVPTSPAETLRSAAAAPVVPAALEAEAAAASKLMGKPLAFKTQAELDAYLGTLVTAKPQGTYDPDGFLASIGMRKVMAPGRQDTDTLNAVLQIPDYRPGTLVNGHEILPQIWAWDIAKAHPQAFLAAIQVTNPIVEAPSRIKALWAAPFREAQTGVPTGETLQARYGPALADLPPQALTFDQDFHGGLPSSNDPNPLSYGTYTIMMQLGFTDAQARRVATHCVGIDENKTPYGNTSFSPTGEMDRHFNLNRGGQDTRLIWARRHLTAAEKFGRQGAYNQAEIELGCGLHSLQDCFAHGQLTPSMHGVIGEFPDQVTYDPIAMYEATAATVAYLQVYLRTLEPKPATP